jgi:hypothetical protein
MCVRAKDEPLHARCTQRRGDGGGIRVVLDRPRRAFGEPAPDRREQARRMQVDVNVDQRRAIRESASAN